MDRDALITQMAKAFAGEPMLAPSTPPRESRRRAEDALARVELYLGADVEQARDILSKVLEDVT